MLDVQRSAQTASASLPPSLTVATPASAAALDAALAAIDFDPANPDDLGRVLRVLLDPGYGCLPLPGGGHTLQRWQMLASVAGRDLGLVKLFEGHTDAVAILAELNGPAAAPGSCWGVWAAEPPDARLEIHPLAESPAAAAAAAPDAGQPAQVVLRGRKSWCSGAAVLTHAVVTGWDEQGAPCLAAVVLDQPGVRLAPGGWHAVGMAATASVDVYFDEARATSVGRPGDYTARPGFWHGGMGIAACWHGAAAALARVVQSGLAQRPDPYRAAHLGAIVVALSDAAAVLRAAAAEVDRAPQAEAHELALRVRLSVERAAVAVMDHAGRALGAAPFCRDAGFARTMADLPVFLRQSHADHDLAALGTLHARSSQPAWLL